MFKRNILLIFLFFALLLLAVYLARPEWLGIELESKESKLLWPDFDKEAVREIRVISESGEEHRLGKSGEKWLVESKDNFPADEELVEKALTAVLKMEIGEVASLRKEKWPEFGVGEEGIRVSMSDKSDKTNMINMTNKTTVTQRQEQFVEFWVGKSGRDYQSSYVRRSGDDKIYLVAGNLGSLFGTREWREMRIMGKMEETGKIKGLEFKYRDSQLVLQKIGEEWMMKQPSATAAAKNRVDFVLNELKELRAIEATTSADGVNFDEPEIELTMVYGGNEAGQKTLLIDAKDESGKNRYARLKDGEIIYLISAADAGVFERTVEDFLEPN